MINDGHGHHHCHCCCCSCGHNDHHEGKNWWGDKDMSNKEYLLKKKEKLESILAEVNKKLKEAK